MVRTGPFHIRGEALLCQVFLHSSTIRVQESSRQFFYDTTSHNLYPRSISLYSPAFPADTSLTMGLIIRANDALNINPPSGSEELTVNGSNWLWAVTAIFALSFLGFFATSFRARSGEKIFHYIFTVSLLVGSITYYAWASDLAYMVIAVINGPNGGSGWTRQIFYAKYIFCKLVLCLSHKPWPLTDSSEKGLWNSRLSSLRWVC